MELIIIIQIREDQWPIQRNQLLTTLKCSLTKITFFDWIAAGTMTSLFNGGFHVEPFVIVFESKLP